MLSGLCRGGVKIFIEACMNIHVVATQLVWSMCGQAGPVLAGVQCRLSTAATGQSNLP